MGNEEATKLAALQAAQAYTEASSQSLYGGSLPQGAVILDVPHYTALRGFKQLQEDVHFGAAGVNGLHTAGGHAIKLHT